MGWTLPQSGSGFVTVVPSGGGVSAITLPNAMQPGDDVWVVIFSKVAMVANGPSGFTIIGSEANPFTGGSSYAQFVSFWRRTAQAGDSFSPAITIPGSGTIGFMAFLIRSTTGSPGTIVTDAHGNSATAVANAVVGPFNPTLHTDLRMAFVVLAGSAVSSTFASAPSVTPSTNNPTAIPMATLSTYIVETASALGGTSFYSLIDTDTDSGSSNFPLLLAGSATNQAYYARWFALTDGTSFNGGYAEDIDPFMVDPAIAVIAPSSLEEELSAAAGKFGGGAHIL